MKHLIGPTITVGGRYRRCHCAWCGLRLEDADLANMAVAPGSKGPPPEFPPGEWLDVEDIGGVTRSTLVKHEGDEMPLNCCMEDVVPRLSLVPDD